VVLGPHSNFTVLPYFFFFFLLDQQSSGCLVLCCVVTCPFAARFKTKLCQCDQLTELWTLVVNCYYSVARFRVACCFVTFNCLTFRFQGFTVLVWFCWLRIVFDSYLQG
jgi:hypothetical protein